MSERACPNCNTEMQPVVDVDITVDRCLSCDGRFLDRGELNALATGLAGNIELRSLIWTDVLHETEGFNPSDDFSQRRCPDCKQAMKKIGMVCFADVVFDVCEQCEGFFLDAGEVKTMNDKLRQLSIGGMGEEYRSESRGRLVRGNRLHGAVLASTGLIDYAVGTTHLQIVVYFNRPLDMGLNVGRESWVAKLSKVFGLYGKQDIQTGDNAFDRAFVIQGNDPATVIQLLSKETRQALQHFVSAKPRIFSTPGSIQVLDHCIEYSEGPYSGECRLDWEAGTALIIDKLVQIAELIDRSEENTDHALTKSGL